MVNCWLPGNPLRPAALGTENIRVYGERRCGTAGVSQILDFPCNQFGEQAPGSIQEIHEFCMVNFNIEFPQFDKVEKPEASVKDLL